jgi:hypothetical protein
MNGYTLRRSPFDTSGRTACGLVITMSPKTPLLLSLLVAIALATGCMPSHKSDQSNADASLKSLNSNTPTLITFINRSTEPVDIYWLDFGGNRQLYKTLEAGGSYTQQTFLTHPWLVTDARGKPWNVYMPEAQPRTIYLQAPSSALIAR